MAGVQSLAYDADLVFDMDYFSGCQVAIYIGDVWVDEISHFQMMLSESKTPLYSYGSQLWDALARGPKIVRGSFAINFKEAGYLFAVLNHYRQQIKQKGSVLSPYKGKDKIMRANIERIMSLPENSQLLYDTFSDLAGFASEVQKKSYGVDVAENVFEQFEDAVWGRQGGVSGFNKTYNVESRSALSSYLNNFDIYVQFGDFTNDLSNHTIIKLESVELVEQSMLIEANDEPILEAYTFMARNWV